MTRGKMLMLWEAQIPYLSGLDNQEGSRQGVTEMHKVLKMGAE